MAHHRATVKLTGFVGEQAGSGSVRFLDDAAAARLKSAAARRAERARRRTRICAPFADGTIVDNADEAALRREFGARLAGNARLVVEADRDRMRDGYAWLNGDETRVRSPHGGVVQPGFVFHGLRSRDHVHIERFVSTLPKARRIIRRADAANGVPHLVAGFDKASLNPMPSKLQALDMPYVEGNKLLRSWWRVDNDGLYTSWGHLLDELLEALGDPALLPHLAVADVLPDGRVMKPHLLWFLPHGGGVRFDESAPERPKAAWTAVLRALHGATLSIGSDMGGCLNPMRVKNPCSPHWGVAVVNERDAMSMTDMLIALDRWTNVPDQVLERFQAAAWGAQDGIAPVKSNELWSSCLAACWGAMRDWRTVADERAALTGDDLKRAFLDHVGDTARRALGAGRERQAMAIASKASVFAAAKWDPTKASGARMRRGVLADGMRGLDLADRQAAGARYVAADRRDGTIEAIRAAVAALRAEGVKPTQTAVAERSGKGRRTVVRRWAEAMGEGAEPKRDAPRDETQVATPAKVRVDTHSRPRPAIRPVTCPAVQRFGMPAFLRDDSPRHPTARFTATDRPRPSTKAHGRIGAA